MKRRKLINAAVLLSTSLPFKPAIATTDAGWRMHDEAEPHTSACD